MIRKFNSYDLLKIIAITAMIIDHIGLFFNPELPIYRIIGRIAFPCFLFLIGYSGKFINRRDIIVLAILIIVFDFIFLKKPILGLTQSILPSIILGRYIYYFFHNWIRNNLIATMLLCTLYHIALVKFLQYGSFALIFIISGDLKNRQFSDRYSKLFFITSFVLYCYLESSITNSAIELSLLGLLITGLCYYLYNFSLFTTNYSNKFALYCSRYSLYIYVIHFQLFKIINWYQYGI